MKLEQVGVDAITVHPENARVGDIDAIAESIQTNGFFGTIVAQRSTGHIIVGNHRYQAARQTGMKKVPVIFMDIDDDQARRIMLADNRTNDMASYDDQLLADLLQSVPALEGTGFDDDDLADLLAGLPSSPLPPTDGIGGPLADDELGAPEPLPAQNGSLADKFLAPPFSVLDTRQGYWRARKQQWLSLGIKSEVGREANLLQMSESILMADNGIDPWQFKENQPNYSQPSNVSGNTPAFFYKKREMEQIAGRELSSNEAVEVFQTGKLTAANGEVVDFEVGDVWSGAGTSIFDPVLCEIAYRWWCPRGGTIVDPFAGGSVRGVVAGKLGYNYHGVELRNEQVEANREQNTDILGGSKNVTWTQGDSTKPESWSNIPAADFVFTCPPYYDLEVYSDEPGDLSALETDDEFFTLLEESFRRADEVLQNDRFICVVMGEVREDKGPLRDMIGRTANAARNVGWSYYNDAILLTAVGSLALRAGRIFRGGRKLARCHQYVMVFVKGDWKKAHDACGALDDVVLDLETEL